MSMIARGKPIVDALEVADRRAFWQEFTKRKSGGDSPDRAAIAQIFARYSGFSEEDVEAAIHYGCWADR